jgi:Flp pilus assembly protein TadG
MAAMKRTSKSERGAALVEFALALPLLLVVIAGIVDFGFLFQRYEVLTNAVREGARVASLPGYINCGAVDPAPINDRIVQYVQTGLALSTPAQADALTTVTVTCDTLTVAAPGGGTFDVDTAVVTATYNHSFLMLGPMLSLINKTWGNTMTLTATSEMRFEPGAGS